jgi:hypothetical protein
MLSSKREYQYMKASEAVWDVAAVSEVEIPTEKLTRFHGEFTDCMEMYADVHTVAEYLNVHQDWFCRCAQPMTVESIGTDGYALTIGRFGAFGYEVEPKIGLELLPPESGAYRIETIAIPNYIAPGYDVDFKAVMNLVEKPASAGSHYDGAMTGVNWELDLSVYLHFPKFIQRLPQAVIQATGDRLLNQIVRQVSRRLTHKVQEDFHTCFNLPLPGKAKRRNKGE